MVDLAQTIEEWKDLQSVKVDDQVKTDGKNQLNDSYSSWQTLFFSSISVTFVSLYVMCQHLEN